MFLCVLVCVSIYLPVAVTEFEYIERASSGDIFQASCNSCHLFAATCASGFVWFGCCSKCACENGATIYRDMCYSDLAHTQFQCKLFIEDDQYYGLSTFTLRNRGTTHIGYVMYRKDWNQKRYTKCIIHETSRYWDTKHWSDLFTYGRHVSDFDTTGSSAGVILKFVGGKDKKILYDGLLIKFSMSCFSEGAIETSCLIVKFAGKRDYTIQPDTTVSTSTKPPPTTTTKTTTLTSTKWTTTHTSTKWMSTHISTTHISRNSTMFITGQEISTTLSAVTGDHVKLDLKFIVVAVLVGVLLLFFCCVFICCYKIKENSSISNEKQYLVSSQQSYQSSEVGSLQTSSEFEEVNAPCYSDINELILLDSKKMKGTRAPSETLFRGTQEQTKTPSIATFPSNRLASESEYSYYSSTNT